MLIVKINLRKKAIVIYTRIDESNYIGGDIDIDESALDVGDEQADTEADGDGNTQSELAAGLRDMLGKMKSIDNFVKYYHQNYITMKRIVTERIKRKDC